jgi:hypothetical protein
MGASTADDHPRVAGAPGSGSTPAAGPVDGDSGAALDDDRRAARRATLELVAVILLSATTILTAWSAFQASKWGGAMSIAFSEASSSRVESSRLDGAGNVRISNHIGLWSQWATAVGEGNSEVADFLVERFPEPLATAHQDWLAAGGVGPGGPASPFDMPSYVVPEKVEAATWEGRAGDRFAAALQNNQRSDNYTILTVLFAAVLFFTAMSTRLRWLGSQQVLLAAALFLGAVGVFLLISFPKLV